MNVAAVWAGRGHRVEGVASPAGDVLLEAIGSTPGVLTIRAPGYRPVTLARLSSSRSPGTIALERLPQSSVRVIVVSSRGQPLPGAAVEMAPLDPLSDPELTITDSAGSASFHRVPAEPVWITAAAEGFLSTMPAQVIPAAAGDRVVRVILNDRRAEISQR